MNTTVPEMLPNTGKTKKRLLLPMVHKKPKGKSQRPTPKSQQPKTKNKRMMKKINTLKTILIITVITVLTACSKDDAPSNNNKRPVKIEIMYDDRYNFTNDITYNGNLLSEYTVVGEGIAKTNLTYNTANKITKLVFTTDGWTNVYTYQYNSQGNIETITDSGNKTTFSYNANGTINQTVAQSFDDSGNERKRLISTFAYENDLLKSIATSDFETGHYKESFTYDANNNLTTIIKQSQSSDGITFNRTDTYTISYDDKINPAYKILDDSNVLINGGWSFYNIYNGHSGLKEAYTQTLGNGHFMSFYSKNNYITNKNYEYITSYNYTYDDAGYPVKLVETTRNFNNIEYNYVYENY